MAHGTGHEFIEKTKYQNMETSIKQRGLSQPELERPYEGMDPMDLPDPLIMKNSISEIIEQRSSHRTYSDNPLSLEELSYLLWCTQGVKRVVTDSATFRTVPSAGARHALETCVLANNVAGLQAGIYRYLPIEHQLGSFIIDATIAEKVKLACLNQTSITNSAATFIWFAVVERMSWKYNERGYRYLFLDAGHVCQNLYLAAEALDCGVCAIAAFDDDMLNDVLRLDGKHELAIYLGTVGRKP